MITGTKDPDVKYNAWLQTSNNYATDEKGLLGRAGEEIDTPVVDIYVFLPKDPLPKEK